jgi:hypothetical protein
VIEYLALSVRMGRILVLVFLLLSCVVHAQRWDNFIQSEDELSFFRFSYNIGYELNNGIFQSVEGSYEKEDYAIGVRYYWGQEFDSHDFFGNRRFPVRDIQSFGVLYYTKLAPQVRFGFGPAITSGNARGDLIDRTYDGLTSNTYWYQDIRYRAVSISLDATVGVIEYDKFNLDLFLRGEIAPRRIYAVVGIGLSIFLNNDL